MALDVRWSGLVLCACAVACSGPDAGPLGELDEPLIGGTPDTVSRGVLGLVSDSGGCTGSLLAPNLVLTARHCVAALNNSTGTVDCNSTRFGGLLPASSFLATWDDNIRNGAPDNSIFEVSEVRTTSGNAVCGNDVALMILATNVPAAAAPLVEPRVDEAPRLNESFSAVGYGITDPDDSAGSTFGERLRVNGLNVGCVGTSCGGGVTGTEWAAETPVCSGDSGGPALDSSGRVIGIASRGDESCGAAIYGSVAAFRTLIVDTALDAADQGGYSPPTWTGAGMDAGVPEPDAGQPDAGQPDAGQPDAGQPDAGVPDSGDANPTDAAVPDSGEPDPDPPVDAGDPDPPLDGGSPLGEPCTNACGAGHACYIPEGRTSGICVPPCEPGGDECPFRYQCSTRLAVCLPAVPEEDPGDSDDDEDGGKTVGCGCRTAPDRSSNAGLALVLALALAAGVRRRRT